MSDSINSDGTVPDPLSEQYAVRVEPKRLVNTKSWSRSGDWKFRQFGNEIQLRNLELPGVHLDMFRAEAEALHQLLGEMLGKPAPLPYRTPWWTRLRHWWMRRVWKRKHYAELDAWRDSVIEDFTRRGPWG